MPNENTFWSHIRDKMKGRWRAQRFEDKLSEGIPDVGYAIKGVRGLGFIELKYKSDWPKRPTTPLRLKHYTTKQRNWIRFFGAHADRVFLFLKVKRDYLLFHWPHTWDIGKLTKEELFSCACRTWKGSVNWDEFLEEIR